MRNISRSPVRTNANTYTRGNAAPKIEHKPSVNRKLTALPPRFESFKQRKEQISVNNKKAIKISAVALTMVMLFAFMIFSRVQLDEINRNIAATEKQIEIVNSKNVELNMELNEMISIEKVEEYAVNNLGMVKVQDYQVVYVDLSDDDRVLMAGGKETMESKTVTRAADD